MSILVVAAHPDDEVLGCGGTLAHTSDEHDVHILILGEGITSRLDSRDEAEPRQIEQLRSDAQEAARLLGSRSLECGGLPDNRFDQVPLLDIVKMVEARVQALTPDTIYTHHPGDLNVDHGLTFRAVLTATRPEAEQPVRELLSFEIPSSTEWAFQRIVPTFRPNVFVDISRTIETKIAAMKCYESEARRAPALERWKSDEKQGSQTKSEEVQRPTEGSSRL